MNQKIFNNQTFRVWKEIDAEAWQSISRDILEVFFSSIHRQYGELRSAMKSQDWSQVKKVAHTMKSSMGNVGGEKAHFLLAIIEQSAGPAWQSCEAVSSELEITFGQTITELLNFQRELQAALESA